MAKWANYVYLFVYFFTTLFIAVKSDKCVQKSPCVCEYEDGRLIDLSPLSSGDFLSDTKENLTYYFHACSNKELKIPNDNLTYNGCKETSLCLYNRTNSSTLSLGNSKDAKFALSPDKNIYDIVYPSGPNQNITTIVTLACTEIQESLLYIKEDNSKNLILFSPLACTHITEHGLSTGSILVILLLIFTGVYLLGGAAILHFLRGARGKEMIPNIDFWNDLPLLVRDGVVFLQNGCKPSMIPTSESYDRI